MDRPCFFKDMLNGPLSFRKGLSGPSRLGSEGVGTFKVRSLRGFSRQRTEEMPSGDGNSLKTVTSLNKKARLLKFHFS